MQGEGRIYLDNACTSLYDSTVLAGTDDFLELLRNERLSASEKTVILQTYLDKARAKVAELIGCTPNEVALVESTSHGLGIVSEIVEIRQNENVLVCDLEYQASYLCMKRKQEKIGFEIRKVESRGGEITDEIFKNYLDENTRLIILSSVQEINGYKADVKAITELAHQYKCYVAIDGVQEVGAMSVNVENMSVDFYCAGSKKWIGSPFGMGFLYVRKGLISKLEPSFYSYFNTLLPDNYSDYPSYLENPRRSPFDDCGIVPTAQKYEIGGYRNYLGAIGLTRAIEVLLSMGPEVIEERILSLNQRLLKGLERLGIRVASPIKKENMSSIVSFNFGFKNGGSEEEKKLVDYLRKKNIFVSLRCSTWTGGVRVSIHYYNTEKEIDLLLSEIEKHLSQTGKHVGN